MNRGKRRFTCWRGLVSVDAGKKAEAAERRAKDRRGEKKRGESSTNRLDAKGNDPKHAPWLGWCLLGRRRPQLWDSLCREAHLAPSLHAF